MGDAGSIGDLFTTLGASPPVLDQRFAELKERLRPPENKLLAAWHRLQTKVRAEVSEIKEKGSTIIPTIEFSDIDENGGNFPDDVARSIRRRGCVVVRNTIDQEAALAMKQSTRDYIAKNRQHLSGFPKEKPQVWECYWSKAQGQMRQHANILKTQTALNRLWHCRPVDAMDGHLGMDVHRPLTYGERLRIREAGDESFTLGPHVSKTYVLRVITESIPESEVDGGSVERWEDEEYRKVYSKVLEGNWEEFDAWDATHRTEACCDLYNLGLGLCTVFRSFQGWMSLSNSGRGRGALMVVPMVREAMAYIMLRPFMQDVPPSSFCGANPGRTTDLFPQFHADLIDGLIPIPDVCPGDTVWWHCDLVHSVEAANAGVEDASVFYIPALPFCRKNVAYLRTQADHFARGLTPPDFPPNHAEVRCVDRCLPEDLCEAGLTAMGLNGVPEARVDGETEADFAASRALRDKCRKVLADPWAKRRRTQ